jgi:WD40 repeat protein
VPLSCDLRWLDAAEPAPVGKSAKEIGKLDEVLVCVSPHRDQTTLFLGTTTGKVIHWDPGQQIPKTSLPAHTKDITRVFYSPDGQLVTCSVDGAVALWSPDLALNKRFDLEAPVFGAAVSPDGQLLAAGGKDGNLKVWDIVSGQQRADLVGHADSVSTCAWLTNKVLVSAGTEGYVHVWEPDVPRCVRQHKPHQQHISQILLNANRDWYATASWDRTVKLWNAQHRQRFSIPEGAQAVTCLALSTDASVLAVAYWDGVIKLLSMQTGEQIDEFPAHDESLIGCTFVADSKFLVTADQQGRLRAWDMQQMGVTRYLNRHDGEIYAVEYTPDNLQVLSVAYDGHLKIWDRDRRSEIGFIECHDKPATALTIAPDNRYWATGDAAGVVKVWDVEQQVLDSTLLGHVGLISDLQFLPVGERLVSASWDVKVRLWSVPGQMTERIFDGHSKEVADCDVSADGRRMVSASWDFTARIWDLTDRRTEFGKEIAALEGHTERVLCCAFSPDGSKVATGSGDTTVRVWSVEKPEDFHIITGHTTDVTACRFSPDGELLLTADRHGKVIAWDVGTLQSLSSIDHDQPVLAMTIAPDGREAVIGDQAGRVRFLELQYGPGPVWVPAQTVLVTQKKGLFSRKEQVQEGYVLTCRYCGTQQSLAKTQLGQRWQCPKCKNALMVCPRATLPVED